MSMFWEDRGRASLMLPYRCRGMVDDAALHAQRLKEAAEELDGVSSLSPLPGWIGGDQDEADRWWTTVFGDTESGLEEQKDALARRYHRLRWWRRKDRRAVLWAYIRVDQMLTVGHGLETVWR